VTARLGVRHIPTLGLHAGVQRRFLVGGQLEGVFDLPDAGQTDLVVAALCGFDYRFDRSWIAGISAGATHAFALGGPPYDALEAGFHLAFYWYPGVRL
jgi:hypothetical protein